MKFKTGDRVVKVMGVRMEGKVIPEFSWKAADDGTYRPPMSSGVVWVEWENGTRGWVSAVHIRKVSAHDAEAKDPRTQVSRPKVCPHCGEASCIKKVERDIYEAACQILIRMQNHMQFNVSDEEWNNGYKFDGLIDLASRKTFIDRQATIMVANAVVKNTGHLCPPRTTKIYRQEFIDALAKARKEL